jgi:hypothetical protein
LGANTIFQGLFIDRTQDGEDYSSEVTRHIRETIKRAESGPEARLLGERSYAPRGRVLRVVLDSQVPGDDAVQLEYAPPPPAKPRTDFDAVRALPEKDAISGPRDPDGSRPDPAGRPSAPPSSHLDPLVRPSTPPSARLNDDAPDPDFDDDPTPRLPSQAETKRIEPLTALRYLYRAAGFSQAEDAGPIMVSQAKLTDMIRAEGRVAPRLERLSRALRLLRNWGLLRVVGSFSALVYDDWAEARDALRDAAEVGTDEESESRTYEALANCLDDPDEAFEEG